MKKVPCEIYSRIMGYLRPVNGWNIGKKQEFEERVNYRVQEEPDASITVQDQRRRVPAA